MPTITHATCPECGYFQVAAPRCCECAAPLSPLTSSEQPDDATLLAAIADALEDEESGFYVWTPGTPLLSTRD